MLKLTIVMATYNAGKMLRQALDSIKYQTYKNIELIVVDGLSSDNTLEIIKEYEDVITKYISEKDTGIYNAFNKGIMMATGDYICFLGSDDCYCNYDVIAKAMEELEGNLSVLSAPIKEINIATLREKFRPNRLTREEIFSGNMIPHPGLIVSLDVMKKYMFNEKNKIVSDYEFLMRYLIDGGSIKFIDIPIVYFATGGISGGGADTLRAQRQAYEYMTLVDRLGLDDKYVNNMLISNCKKMNSWKFHLKWFVKIIFNKVYLTQFVYGLRNVVVRLIGRKKHKCDLKYCRWCGRNNI